MNPTAAYFVERLEEILLSGQWVTGTNIKAEIKDLTFQQATTKEGDRNSIADLVFHMDYYIAGVLQVLRGGALTIRDKYSFDAPDLKTEEDWQARIQTFSSNAKSFIAAVGHLTEEDFQSGFVKPEYGSVQRNIDVIIEHNYYHLGQIVLIKKHLLEQ